MGRLRRRHPPSPRNPAVTDSPTDYPQRPPDVVGEAETTIRTTPGEVLEFILDVERYKAVDSKIGTIHRNVSRGMRQLLTRIG
jgi:hypothetical protein